jgi:hypothetical protein
MEAIAGSPEDARGAGLRRAAGDLGPIGRPRRVLRVQAGIVILGGACLDRLGQLAVTSKTGLAMRRQITQTCQIRIWSDMNLATEYELTARWKRGNIPSLRE